MKNTHTLCGLLLSFEKLSVNLPMGGTAGGSWEWGVGGATEKGEAIKSLRSHQLIESSRFDCTVRITDHNVARWIVHKELRTLPTMTSTMSSVSEAASKSARPPPRLPCWWPAPVAVCGLLLPPHSTKQYWRHPSVNFRVTWSLTDNIRQSIPPLGHKEPTKL